MSFVGTVSAGGKKRGFKCELNPAEAFGAGAGARWTCVFFVTVPPCRKSPFSKSRSGEVVPNQFPTLFETAPHDSHFSPFFFF